jgi:hypothetical protein
MTSASVKMSDYMARVADSLEGLRSDMRMIIEKL